MGMGIGISYNDMKGHGAAGGGVASSKNDMENVRCAKATPRFLFC
jgi:hypothetical protein